ncbi:hypothetical protein [Paraburkholderia sp. J41]|uniref:hypothetical protein n=1 Tax=Paraburkholderia sp. J41 TaxID=2805433 RepID=UPI002AC326B0|nr:hypothetical protein [Paraburkholderia sp. J41]
MSCTETYKVVPVSGLLPRAADPEMLQRLNQVEERWPKGLYRFAPFKRLRDGEAARYRAICWNQVDRKLHVLRLKRNAAPTGRGDWEVWSEDAADKPLSDIARTDESVAPDYMNLPLTQLPKELKSSLTGFERRDRILRAFCFRDTKGLGNPSDFVFDDEVVTDSAARAKALRYVCQSLGKLRGWATYVCKLLHQFCHFGGAPNAMLAQHHKKGCKGQSRTGKLVNKSGRLSAAERREKRHHEATGKPITYRRAPTSSDDEKQMSDALKTCWAVERKTKLEAYDRLMEHYIDVPEWQTPTLHTFLKKSTPLIVRDDLLSLRNRHLIQEQTHAARVGTATTYTQGRIEIADLDAFTARVPIAVVVKGKVKPIHIKVILAVSRNFRTILGAELVIRGEKAEAYRRCIASIYLDKEELAKELGLQSADGLVSGTIDGIFVDNGAGAAHKNAEVACGQMRLGFEIAPPSRGDLKAVVESINSMMAKILRKWPGGYDRENDKVRQEERRKARTERPMPIKKFKKCLWLAIQHHNLHGDRSKLRDIKMLMDGNSGTPAALWEHAQLKRTGDAARKLTPREVFRRFVPWEPYTVLRGLVHFSGGYRYESPELTALWTEHVKTPKPQRKPLVVKVKALDGSPHALIWEMPNGEENLLRLIEEDALRVGNLMWDDLNLTAEADSMRKLEEENARRVSAKHVSTVAQHTGVGKAERTRIANGDLGGLKGESMVAAKRNADEEIDRDWGRKQAEALGLTSGPIIVPVSAPAPAAPPEKSERKVLSANARFVERMRARRNASRGNNLGNH